MTNFAPTFRLQSKAAAINADYADYMHYVVT